MAKEKIGTSIMLMLFVITLIFFIFGRSAFAQSENELSQQFLQIYQASSNKIDTLISFIAMIATIFGVIVAIVVGFFAIRQLSVDREIKAYKEEIQQQKELIKGETMITKKELTDLRSWATEKKSEIQETLNKPISKKTKQELKRLEAEIDKLREEIAYKRGSISTLPVSGIGVSSLGTQGSITIGNMGLTKICSRCGMVYTEDPFRVTTYNQCPKCGNINL